MAKAKRKVADLPKQESDGAAGQTSDGLHPKRQENPNAACPTATNQAIAIAMKAAWDQGWWIEKTGGKHFKCMSPDGKGLVYAASTPSDWRSIKNTRALLRKYGVNFSGK